ncbi:MAG: alpha/beta hydrolase [Acidobacteriota bacterium]
MKVKVLVLAVAFLLIDPPSAYALEAPSGTTEFPLWPGTPPGDQPLEVEETYAEGRVENVRIPTLTVFLPPRDRATGTAVVICLGGGYWLLAVDHEGYEVARWLNSLGVAAFVLKYRHRHFRHPVPMWDAQRAIRTVRARAEEWGVDPQRVGILGFSAGGHLASTVATHFDAGNPEAADPVERQGSRPDFAVLIYPVITFLPPALHQGSRDNLLGPNPAPELVRSLSNETQVTAETPPVFLVHSADDDGVPVQNSIEFFLACRRVGVPAELHVYERGGHGYGMRADRCPAAADWPGRCALWLRQHGWIR